MRHRRLHSCRGVPPCPALQLPVVVVVKLLLWGSCRSAAVGAVSVVGAGGGAGRVVRAGGDGGVSTVTKAKWADWPVGRLRLAPVAGAAYRSGGRRVSSLLWDSSAAIPGMRAARRCCPGLLGGANAVTTHPPDPPGRSGWPRRTRRPRPDRKRRPAGRREVHLREKTFYRMLYETAARGHAAVCCSLISSLGSPLAPPDVCRGCLTVGPAARCSSPTAARGRARWSPRGSSVHRPGSPGCPAARPAPCWTSTPRCAGPQRAGI